MTAVPVIYLAVCSFCCGVSAVRGEHEMTLFFGVVAGIIGLALAARDFK